MFTIYFGIVTSFLLMLQKFFCTSINFKIYDLLLAILSYMYFGG